jgi:glycosyltransferase involved in cell wall biosynthesis
MSALGAIRSGLVERRASASEATRARTDVLLAATAYLVLYLAAYVFVIAPTYGGSGLVNRLAADGSIVLALALALLPAAFLPIQANRPSDVGLWVVYLAGYVPALVVPAFVLGKGWGLAGEWLVISGGFTLVTLLANGIRIPSPPPRLRERQFGPILAVVAILFVGGILVWFGLPRQIPSLFDVTSARDDYREALAEVGGFSGYAVYWTGQVFGPLLVAYGIWTRRRATVIGGLAVFLLVYSITAFRSLIFAIVLLVGLIAIVRRWRRSFGVVLPVIASLLIVASTIAAALGWWTPMSLVVRRLLVVPGQVMAYYSDFFYGGVPYELSHSVLRGVVAQPYPESPPALIGRLYFGDPRVYANGNLWADAMANFGLPGMIAASVGLLVVLVAMNIFAARRPASIALPLAGLGVWRLTNSGLLTTLASHGLTVLIFILLLLPAGRRAQLRTSPPRIAHLTSVHRSDDPRIHLKECASLAAAGFEVVLIGRGGPPAQGSGVRFVSVGDAATRRSRMTALPARVLRAAWRERADIYHLHDPELIPVGLVLKALGRHVVYDAHEDLPRQIAYKAYLPGWLRRVTAPLAGLVEWIAGRAFDGVVAVTPHIASRFPPEKTVVVRNYPLIEEFADPGVPDAGSDGAVEREDLVAYVGRLTEPVGALQMADAAKIVGAARPTRFVFAGPVDQILAERIAGRASPIQIELPGLVDRATVVGLLRQARLGLVLFQPFENYVRAYPTKLFEYMAAGVPVVASDFADWRAIVAPAGCGSLVDPQQPAAAAAAILELLDDPKRAAEMGARGRRAVEERYTWATEAETLVGFYRRLLMAAEPVPDVVAA